MVKVAIAGGTGSLGRTILDVLKEHPEHKAVILTRKTAPSSNNHIQSLVVDYTDIPALTAVLEENEIHTVIAAFGISGNSLSTSQINLIKAADASQPTKRFIPTSFAIPYPESGVEILPPLQAYFDSINLLKETSLEWTVFHNGIFLDYFGCLGPEGGLKSHLKPNTFAIDIPNRVAAIPGDGNVPVTFTYTFDVARFVVRTLRMEKWEDESRVIGETVTWNEFLRVVEDVTESKFEVHYDSVEKLKRFEITELPGHTELYGSFPKQRYQWFMAIFELWTTDGTSKMKREGSLNEKFPEIKSLGVREFLERSWKGAI
ncbi:nmrA-like family protein [Zopfia rhizophila CBS 207.26]|uniref:NmrA-like family protein n=1 Tax=Zopfia rhizophila CBS 207.26 TaxID=1314779 RepID=A0A6A6E5E7_9PEZI|nr:nmrA-like family protein [Zopfia rhizophila CBS 207.26]